MSLVPPHSKAPPVRVCVPTGQVRESGTDREECHRAGRGPGWGLTPGTSSFSLFFLSASSRPLSLSFLASVLLSVTPTADTTSVGHSSWSFPRLGEDVGPGELP